jgi:hypothetical protein
MLPPPQRYAKLETLVFHASTRYCKYDRQGRLQIYT